MTRRRSLCAGRLLSVQLRLSVAAAGHMAHVHVNDRREWRRGGGGAGVVGGDRGKVRGTR